MSTSSSVHLVFQRYRSCRILLREKDWVDVPTTINAAKQVATEESSSSSSSQQQQQHCGLLVYVSFSSAATHESVMKAAQTILQLPVLTRGKWGDDSIPVSLWSLIQDGLAARQPKAACSKDDNDTSKRHVIKPTTSLVLVPQANLISRVKSQGKSIQYHGQMEKTKCQAYFENLTNQIRAELLQEQYKAATASSSETSTASPLPDWFVKWKTAVLEQQHKKQAMSSSATEALPSTPPNQIFRDMTDKYSSWDDTGLPLTDSEGNPLTKSALKRVRKIYEAHSKRHEKWKEKNPVTGAMQNESSVEENDKGTTEEQMTNTVPSYAILEKLFEEALDDSICHVVAGSFGMRQGLEMKSDMGPFCHTVQL